MKPRVLLVDDEPNVLNGFRRHLRSEFDLELAVGGQEALSVIANQGPFSVVVSDMQMPEMSGVQLLAEIRELSPHTARIMLTGNADQRTAVDAVNEGKILRFLNKPCPPEQLIQAIRAGVEHFRLLTAEAELLNQTLSGSISMLTQVLSLAMPKAFGLTQFARKWAHDIAVKLEVEPLWQVDAAATLMRVGCVSLPEDVLAAYLAGEDLVPEHAELVAATPRLAYNLIAAIPRLEPVAEIILAQNDPPHDPTPVASRIIKAVGDFQRFHNTGIALNRMNNNAAYDPQVVELLASVVSETSECVEASVEDLQEGMILVSDILDGQGRLLVAKGLEVHAVMLEKLSMLHQNLGIQEPISVRVSIDPDGLSDALELAATVSRGLLVSGS